MAKTIPGNPGGKTDMGPSKKPTGMGGRTASSGKGGKRSA